ncbi:MAG: hypothetical protein AB9869_15465 [Verrucomicrobiia bacterium]
MKSKLQFALATLSLGLLVTGCQTAPQPDAAGSSGVAFQSRSAHGSGRPSALELSSPVPDPFDFGDFRHANRATREGRVVPN